MILTRIAPQRRIYATLVPAIAKGENYLITCRPPREIEGKSEDSPRLIQCCIPQTRSENTQPTPVRNADRNPGKSGASRRLEAPWRRRPTKTHAGTPAGRSTLRAPVAADKGPGRSAVFRTACDASPRKRACLHSLAPRKVP